MRGLAATIAKTFIYPPIKAIVREVEAASTSPKIPREDAYDVIHARAASRSADFIEPHLNSAMLFQTKKDTWTHALSKVTTHGLYLEFGVFTARSTNHIASLIAPLPIYGFDSFEGLNEDWTGVALPKGSFDLGGCMPSVLPNVTLIKGWFNETVPPFLLAHPETLAFCHLDADTYESTTLVLDYIKDRIRPGTILMFDEFQGFPNWENGEFRAWHEFVTATAVRFEYICFSSQQAVLRILSI